MGGFWRQPVVWMVAGVVTLGLVIGGLLVVFRPNLPIPDEIKKQLNFSVLYPGGSGDYKVDASSVSYEKEAKVLVFHIKSKDRDLTVSQQATPDAFIDIPEYYPKLMEKLHRYSEFETLNGKVTLTRPEELKGGQSAVFNNKGTLMFVHPDEAMSNDEWRRFFNALIAWK